MVLYSQWYGILPAGIEGLPGLAISLWLKETVGLRDFELQRIMSYVTLAWLIKPLWGYLVDRHLTKAHCIRFSLILVWLFVPY